MNSGALDVAVIDVRHSRCAAQAWAPRRPSSPHTGAAWSGASIQTSTSTRRSMEQREPRWPASPLSPSGGRSRRGEEEKETRQGPLVSDSAGGPNYLSGNGFPWSRPPAGKVYSRKAAFEVALSAQLGLAHCGSSNCGVQFQPKPAQAQQCRFSFSAEFWSGTRLWIFILQIGPWYSKGYNFLPVTPN